MNTKTLTKEEVQKIIWALQVEIRKLKDEQLKHATATEIDCIKQYEAQIADMQDIVEKLKEQK